MERSYAHSTLYISRVRYPTAQKSGKHPINAYMTPYQRLYDAYPGFALSEKNYIDIDLIFLHRKRHKKESGGEVVPLRRTMRLCVPYEAT